MLISTWYIKREMARNSESIAAYLIETLDDTNKKLLAHGCPMLSVGTRLANIEQRLEEQEIETNNTKQNLGDVITVVEQMRETPVERQGKPTEVILDALGL
jgi:hypothetical protein